MRYGVHPLLEAEADRLIRESLRGITKHSEKADVITDFKRKKIRGREIYVESGVPDSSIRRGMFHRRANPVQTHLNSREGLSSALQRRDDKGGIDSLSDFLDRGR